MVFGGENQVPVVIANHTQRAQHVYSTVLTLLQISKRCRQISWDQTVPWSVEARNPGT